MEKLKHTIFQKIIDLDCLKFGDFTLKSGAQSKYYLNLRNLISDPGSIKLISQYLSFYLNDIDEDFYICGLPYAGIPYANCISILQDKPLIVLRKERKKYGMCNMIDGLGPLDISKVIIIDDIMTTGSSIRESLPLFQEVGLEVIKSIVIIDRSVENAEISDLGKVECLFKVSELINYYQKGNLNHKFPRITYGERKHLSNNKLFQNILTTMEWKKTNLAISLDYDCLEKIIDTLKLIGEHIIIAKLHVDIIKNFRLEYMTEIVKLSQEMKFFIFEDRKYSEIGAIFKNQYEGGIYQVESWSHLINFHLISGDSNIKVYQNLERKENQGGLLVAQMSNHNNFITPEYTQKVVEVAQDNDSICGFISQEKIAGDNFLYLTPGIKLDVNKNKDHLDQRYKSISEVIINGGTDIIIVGRGITESSNILLETLKYKDLGWSCYLESLKND
jgi:uridine monophosphate synthetase